MALRTAGTKLSFEVLRRTPLDEEEVSLLHRSKSDLTTLPDRKKRKNRASKRKKKLLDPVDSVANSDDPHRITEAPLTNGRSCNGFELHAMRYCATGGSVVCEEATEASVCAVTSAPEGGSAFPTSVRGGVEGFNFGELRQRNVNGGSTEDLAASVVGDDGGIEKDNFSGGIEKDNCSDGIGKEDCSVKASPVEKPINVSERSVLTKSETVESVEWKRIMAEDPNCEFLLCMQHCISYFFVAIYQKLSPLNTYYEN